MVDGGKLSEDVPQLLTLVSQESVIGEYMKMGSIGRSATVEKMNVIHHILQGHLFI